MIGFRADLRLSLAEGRFATCQNVQAGPPDKEQSMKRLMKTLIGTFAVIALGTALAPPAAAASCFQLGDGGGIAANRRPVVTQSGRYLPVSFVRGPVSVAYQNSPGAISAQSNADKSNEPIVGMWEFRFDGPPLPPGLAPDFGLQQFHADGTEMMISLGIPPSGGVCQGVWRKIGKSTYTLNHIAETYVDPDPAVGGARFRFHAVITVDPSGDTFSGQYTVSAYHVTRDHPFDESVPIPQASGPGTWTGTRVHPD